mmetsp:Transcript_11792/g.31145  ORF Transcript_11792/g.31145 Transcript_11792/m.31145 type:complete len:224 (-) Transcript_11792:2819-3490(-)
MKGGEGSSPPLPPSAGAAAAVAAAGVRTLARCCVLLAICRLVSGLMRHARRHHMALHGCINAVRRLVVLDVGKQGHCQIVHVPLVREALEHLADEGGVKVRDPRNRGVPRKRQGSAQSQGGAHEARSLVAQPVREARTHQDCVGAVVGLHALLDHLLKGCHPPRQVPIGDAGLDEVGVHMDIRTELVFRRDLVHEVECVVKLAGAVHELHQERQREVAWLHTL